MKHIILLIAVFFVFTSLIFANSAPVVSSVSASQRTDGSGIVDVYYTLSDADGDNCTVSIEVSNDGGGSWNVAASSFVAGSDIGPGISPGRRHIIWNSKTDLPGEYGTNYRVKVTADDGIASIVPNVVGLTQSAAQAAIISAGFIVGTVSEAYSDTVAIGNVISQDPIGGEELEPGGAVSFVILLGSDGPAGMVWVYINDPGVSGHETFYGYMSKYETTNAQYCAYLNAAKASNDITVSGSYVTGTSGPYSGQNYYYLAGPGYTYDGATNGGAARINWTGSSFTVDSGFENHPVTYVSWYGSTAFASYYGYSLPTEWEWQAVADHQGEFIYGCGTTINNNMANYRDSIHPNGTTVVGAFGTYGYGMCDMAGNVWEWTSTVSGSSRVLRSGCWFGGAYICSVSFRSYDYPSSTSGPIGDPGFRVCR